MCPVVFLLTFDVFVLSNYSTSSCQNCAVCGLVGLISLVVVAFLSLIKGNLDILGKSVTRGN